MSQNKKDNKKLSPRPVVEKGTHLFKKGSVIDFGGGIGTEALFLAENGFDVTNIDADKENIDEFERLAKEKKLKVDGLVKSIENFEFEKAYDNMMSFYVLHFVEREKAKSFIQEMIDNTTESGLHILMDFTNMGDFAKTDKKAIKNNFYSRNDEILKLYLDNEMNILKYQKWLGPTREPNSKQQRYLLIAKKTS